VSNTASTFSSAGKCHGCGKSVNRRYGGEGRYFAYCLTCWLSEKPERDVSPGSAQEQT
jgi:hypothetical protein